MWVWFHTRAAVGVVLVRRNGANIITRVNVLVSGFLLQIEHSAERTAWPQGALPSSHNTKYNSYFPSIWYHVFKQSNLHTHTTHLALCNSCSSTRWHTIVIIISPILRAKRIWNNDSAILCPCKSKMEKTWWVACHLMSTAIDSESNEKGQQNL